MTDELKMEVPTLTLGDEPTAEEAKIEAAAAAAAEIVEVKIEDKIELTPEEQKGVEEFTKKIDITNATHILQYGADAQQKMADFSQLLKM